MQQYVLQFLDPKTQHWITCETGPYMMLRHRADIARDAPGNTLTWRVVPLVPDIGNLHIRQAENELFQRTFKK